jgi:hypothetical protein
VSFFNRDCIKGLKGFQKAHRIGDYEINYYSNVKIRARTYSEKIKKGH